MFLSDSDFLEVIRNTPLVSIDLCILKDREILLGKRKNPPAKDFFFVPGGRILKSESKEKAFTRILKNELGVYVNEKNKKIKLLGIYEHFYDENFFGENEFGTHYIVLSYLVPFEILNKNNDFLKVKDQHSKYIWFNIDKENKNKKNIHPFTLNYFKVISSS